MQTRNVEDVSNGDIGTVTSITNTDESPLVTVDFGDGRAVEYDSSKLELLDLAYATTEMCIRDRGNAVAAVLRRRDFWIDEPFKRTQQGVLLSPAQAGSIRTCLLYTSFQRFLRYP